MLEVRVREHTTSKVVFGKTITKSFGQDFVDIKGDDGRWRHIGYLSHAAKSFTGLVNWENSLNAEVAKELEKIKGFSVNYADAPQSQPEQEQDEFDGED